MCFLHKLDSCKCINEIDFDIEEPTNGAEGFVEVDPPCTIFHIHPNEKLDHESSRKMI